MDTLTRRAHLTAAIRDMPGSLCAADLARISGAAGFSPNRNTARKDARALVAHGILAPAPGTGNQTYTRKDSSCD